MASYFHTGLHHCFRIDRGEAMLFTTHTFRAGFKNRHHFSKEALASLHTSQVVVQGSPLLVGISFTKQFSINNVNLQDLFHSTTHWLKASGILNKFLDNYMNAEPYIPQPKENVNKPLVFVQLMMLWLIWVSGLAAGLFVFFGELMAKGIADHLKQITWPRQRQDNTLHPMTEMPMAAPSAINENVEEYLEDIISIIELE